MALRLVEEREPHRVGAGPARLEVVESDHFGGGDHGRGQAEGGGDREEERSGQGGQAEQEEHAGGQHDAGAGQIHARRTRCPIT